MDIEKMIESVTEEMGQTEVAQLIARLRKRYTDTADQDGDDEVLILARWIEKYIDEQQHLAWERSDRD